MSMIQCPECKNNVSDKANACPTCGFLIADYVEEMAYQAEIKRLTEKIIPVDYQYPEPREKVCIKCARPFLRYARAPLGEPMCKCCFHGKPYPGYEVDFSSGGRLLSLGNDLYIHNQCVKPMNIGDPDSDEYKLYEEKLYKNIQESESERKKSGFQDWKIAETPPDPQAYSNPLEDIIQPELNIKHQDTNNPQCPICKSKNLKKISTVRKAAKISVFGIYGAGDLGKTWQCENCGSKF